MFYYVCIMYMLHVVLDQLLIISRVTLTIRAPIYVVFSIIIGFEIVALLLPTVQCFA